MRNLHKFILENYRIESLTLLRDWERLQYRQCNYKNHRIFTLRCLHNELVPVSIKLKSTLKSERAKKILRSAEKQLLQTRLNSINSLLDNNTRQATPRLPQQIALFPRQRVAVYQAGIPWSSQADSTLPLAESAVSPAGNSQAGNYQAGNYQACLAENTLSQAETAVSQAGNSQASPADNTLSQAESAVSQAGNSQAFPADNTLSQAESVVSRAGILQATPAVRHSARLRA